MQQSNLHAAARASAAALHKAARKRQMRRKKKTAAKKAQPKTASLAAAAKKLKTARTFTQTIHRLAHTMSACFTALLCALGVAAVLAAQSAAAPVPGGAVAAQAGAIEIVATVRDLDLDGRGDLAAVTTGAIRPKDVYGGGAYGASRDGGRRKHAGVDYVAVPGQSVHAPIAGEVTMIGDAYRRNSGLNFVEIRDRDTNLRARVFYVDASIEIGDAVAAGDLIGAAQDLSARYPAGITNHVHVEILSPRGGHLDPTVLLPEPHLDYASARATATLRR